MKELLKTDIQLQWRQGFWLVYFVVSLIYVLILLNIPPESRLLVSLLMIMSDTSMLGVLFVGALILLEKQQGVCQSLFVSPLRPGQYVWSKALSLTLLASTMSILIYLPNMNVDSFTPVLLACVMLTALSFAFLGLGLSVKLQTVNQYFARLMLVSVIIMAPLAPYLLLDRHPAFLLLPYLASLDLMLGAYEALPPWRMLMDGGLVLGWTVLAYHYSLSRVRKHLVYA